MENDIKTPISMSNSDLYIDIMHEKHHACVHLTRLIFAITKKNYVDIITVDGVIKDLRMTMTELMALINKQGEYKDHHIMMLNSGGILINTVYITGLNKYDKDHAEKITLSNGKVIDGKGKATVTLKKFIPKHTVVRSGIPEVEQPSDSETQDTYTLLLKKTSYDKLSEQYEQDKRNTLLRAVGSQFLLEGGVEQLCDVSLQHNGHVYVDLGLDSGTLWAASNIGKRLDNSKTSSSTETKESFHYGCGYNKTNYAPKEIHEWVPFAGWESDPKEVYPLSKFQMADDIVKYHWGGKWRMPTKEEFLELKRQCKWQWCQTPDKITGYLVTGRNDKKIFIPTHNRLHYWTQSTEGALNYFVKLSDSGDGKMFFVKWEDGRQFIRPVMSRTSQKTSNEIGIIKKGDKLYPKNLLSLGDRAPEELYYMGNVDLLDAELDAVIGIEQIRSNSTVPYKPISDNRVLILSSLAPDTLEGITFRAQDMSFDEDGLRFIGIMAKGFDDMESNYGQLSEFYEQCVDSSRIYDNEDWRALLISPYPPNSSPTDYPFTATEFFVALCDHVCVNRADKANALMIKEIIDIANSLKKDIRLNNQAYAQLLNTK